MIIPYANPLRSPENKSEPVLIGAILPEALVAREDLSVGPHTVVSVDDTGREMIREEVIRRKLVTVHGRYTAARETFISISPDTCLRDMLLDFKSPLVFADGIPVFPQTRVLKWQETLRFDLHFLPLHPDSESFTFWEETGNPSGFAVFDIKVSPKGEYWVEMELTPWFE